MKLFEITSQRISDELIKKWGEPNGTFEVDGITFHYSVNGAAITKHRWAYREGVPSSMINLINEDGEIIAKANIGENDDNASITFYSQGRTAYKTNSHHLLKRGTSNWREIAISMAEVVVRDQETIEKELQKRLRRYEYQKEYNKKREAEGKNNTHDFDAFDVN